MSPVISARPSSQTLPPLSAVDTTSHPLFTTPFSPPKLIPPHQLPSSSEHRLLQEINRLCDVKESVTLAQKDKLSALQSKIEQANTAYMQDLHKTAEALSSNNVWNFLRKVANSCVSAFSTIFGLSLASNPATAFAGGALISSGLLSITNLALSECKGWDWITEAMQIQNEEMRAKVKLVLPIACGVMAAGIGLAGSTAAIAANALDFSSKTAKLAQTGFTLFSASSLLGKGASESRLHFANSNLAASENNVTVSQADLGAFTGQFQALLTNFDHTMKQARKAVQSIVQTNRYT